MIKTDDIQTTSSLAIEINQIHKIDTLDILNLHNLSYIESGSYLHVGDMSSELAWILDLSVIRIEFIPLLNLIIPHLIDLEVPFKVAKNKETAKHIIDGSLGYAEIGKVVSIYPKTDEEACKIAKKLLPLTNTFNGPDIPTDSRLSNIVYTRYGSCSPIFLKDNKGNIKRYGYNNKQELVEEVYTIPFMIPKSIKWPFAEIAPPQFAKTKTILKGIYKPLTIIKPDAKGIVYKGIYSKNILNIKPCIIKEGKKNMWADEQGRNIQDRLEWQYELYHDLKNEITLPKVYDLFKDDDDMYLVMEFIKGESLENQIISLYKHNSWCMLPLLNRLQLIDYLVNIVALIERLHSKGYVHRDLTPLNFIIDKKNNIYLIDLELAYSINSQKPNPPFKLGTVGYMSSEQFQQQIPTIKEDIYGMGALMIQILIGMPPIKFLSKYTTAESLKSNISFFVKNEQVSDLITSCLRYEPHERPTLKEIYSTINQFKNSKEKNLPIIERLQEDNQVQGHKLSELISGAIMGLSHPDTVTQGYLWDSQLKEKEHLIGNEQLERKYYVGIHTGMAGIIYTLSVAKRLGYNIDCCQPSIVACIDYIKKKCFNDLSNMSPGLYEGSAGLVSTFIEGFNSGMIEPSSQYIEFIEKSFASVSDQLDVSNGIAGQGIILLKCIQWMPKEKSETCFQNYVNILLTAQLKDGSWNLRLSREKSKGKITGLSYGVAGIVFFLLAYYERFPNGEILNSVQKGLRWLIKYLHKTDEGHWWSTTTNNRLNRPLNSSVGTPGIVLCFIKAYEVLGDPTYKIISENALNSIPSHVVDVDFTQAYGISGLGEIYLEAFRVFKNQEWKQRATWITKVFEHTYLRRDDGSVYWFMNANPRLHSDLMVGICGIIHFLMRYQYLNKISYPILCH